MIFPYKLAWAWKPQAPTGPTGPTGPGPTGPTGPPPPVTHFKINLDKTAMPAAYRDSEYGVWFNDMKNFFELIITGVSWLPNQDVTLDIDIGFKQLDPGILGQCGPGDGNWWNIPAFLGDLRGNGASIMTSSLATVKHATMMFNTDYYKVSPTNETDRSWKRQFFTTAVHECFHAVGIGSLWNGPFRILTYVLSNPILLSTVFPCNIVGTGNPTTAAYTKSGALNEYRAQMVGQSGAASIPIENDGMSSNTIMTAAGGTALAHWRGSKTGTLSGIVNQTGQDMIDEVMTAWSSRNEGLNRWVGRFTIAALADIGWSVDYAPLDKPLHDYKTV